MKQVILIALLLMIVVSISFSQMAYKKGDQVVHAGLGIGGFAGAYGTGGIGLTAGYESAVAENISVGGILGYSSSSQDVWGNYGWDYTYLLIGARGAYHGDIFHNSKVDTYGGVMLGYNIVSSSAKGSVPYVGYVGGSASASYMAFGIFIGTRYYFNPNWAIQGELGYGIGILNIGVAYKF